MTPSTLAQPSIERRRIVVRGVVQGVGFRPFVYGHAVRCGLVGFVLNDSAGVTIEVEGLSDSLELFQQQLRNEAPPLARIDDLTVEALPVCGETTFVIAESHAAAGRTLIAADTATCDDCLRELFDRQDRRYRYPFINCTNCGPRFTIIEDVPYDRGLTTMRDFVMCPQCLAEYENPLDRRFHAQPNACPVCGPQVDLRLEPGPWNAQDTTLPALQSAAAALAFGAILAVKGLGGYHLACDALHDAAVTRLRSRKHREAKPFALMVPDLETARLLCVVSQAEADLLLSRRRPIVLLTRRADNSVAQAVAPGQKRLGLMLPYTPLHHLLLHDFAAAAPGRPAALVLTSGNHSDEPIAYRDDDARERLVLIADGVLRHNRSIHMRCDDSVVQMVAGGPQIMRRSRGYAPEPIPLAWSSPLPVLAYGGHLKNTFCLLSGRQAFVSHHIGDLENLETLTSFREGIVHFQRLFGINPAVVAYDMHPEYLATKEALDASIGPKIAVQHHHAHIASVLAEHGLEGTVIGVAADGTGYGSDGAVWGGEVFAADLRGFERLAHLAYVPLPGGDQAVRQPWRVAAAYLDLCYGSDMLNLGIPFVRKLDRVRWRAMAQMIARGVNSPPTSSLGRLFDAAAALLGLRDSVDYEGQAAIELESLAEPAAAPYPFGIVEGRPATLDARPLVRAMVDDIRRGERIERIAGRFHATIAAMLAAACTRARTETGLGRVALSGGVFQNRLLTEQLVSLLESDGFQVYLNRRVPPNDGGLSLGQAAVAAAQIAGLGVKG